LGPGHHEIARNLLRAFNAELRAERSWNWVKIVSFMAELEKAHNFVVSVAIYSFPRRQTPG
jgi:hypothetical protein